VEPILRVSKPDTFHNPFKKVAKPDTLHIPSEKDLEADTVQKPLEMVASDTRKVADQFEKFLSSLKVSCKRAVSVVLRAEGSVTTPTISGSDAAGTSLPVECVAHPHANAETNSGTDGNDDGTK